MFKFSQINLHNIYFSHPPHNHHSIMVNPPVEIHIAHRKAKRRPNIGLLSIIQKYPESRKHSNPSQPYDPQDTHSILAHRS